MILDKIHHNRLGAYAFMLISVVAFWVQSFFPSADVVWEYNAAPMPLWRVIQPWVTSNIWVSSFIALLFAIALSFNIAQLSSKHQLLRKQSVLSGVVYVIMIGGVLILQKFNPIWITALLMFTSVSHIVSHTEQRKTMKVCFNASLLISFSSLFYIHALFLFPMILGVIIIMRMLSFKGVLAAILGLISPWIIIFEFYLYQDLIPEFLNLWNFDDSLATPFHPLNLWGRIYFISIGLFLFFSLGGIFSYYSTKKIFTRKLFLSFLWMTFYIGVLFMVPFISFQIYPLFAIWAAIIIAHFFDVLGNKFWRESFFLLFILIAIGAQILM